MGGSPFGKLSRDDWIKIGKGALIAAVGAVAGYVSTEVAPQLEEAGAVTAAAIASTVANAILKLLSDTRIRPHFLALLALLSLTASTACAQSSQARQSHRDHVAKRVDLHLVDRRQRQRLSKTVDLDRSIG